MKLKTILLIVVLLAGYSLVSAQGDFNRGLVLRGTHSNWEFAEVNEDHVIWEATLRMEFVNEGKRPILLISPNQEFGKWQKNVMFTLSICRGENEKGPVLLKNCEISLSSKPESVNHQDLRDLALFLDTDQPPQNAVVIIKPGDSIQFDDKIRARQNFEKRHGAYVWMNQPLSSQQKIRIHYEVSLVQYQKDPDLLEKLQRRWRRHGYFPIDENGGFSIISEFLRKG